jgi:phage baseplate assembly protein W
MRGDNLQKCSIDDSIRQHIQLLVTTTFGEIEYDEKFGCIVWDTDFDNLTAVNKMRDIIKQSLVIVIRKYETRLEKIVADVNIQQQLISGTRDVKQVKKRVILQIAGLIKSTNLPFSHTYSFFSGPLSY